MSPWKGEQRIVNSNTAEDYSPTSCRSDRFRHLSNDLQNCQKLVKHKDTDREMLEYNNFDNNFCKTSERKSNKNNHTGEKPYKCQYCDKRFKDTTKYMQHERIHTGEKPYQCQYCDKRFNRPSDCKKHERTHTGELPYQSVPVL